MAYLRHLGSDLLFVPASRAVVGRAPASALVVPDSLVSAEHAALIWTGAGWTLRDLGSRNGTWVGEKRVPAGETERISAGDELQFGSGRWTLADDTAPGPVAFADGQVRPARSGMLSLPDDDLAEVVVFESAGTWTLEKDGMPRPARDGERVSVGGVEWVLHLPRGGVLPPTAEADVSKALGRIGLHLRVSADGEYVEIDVRAPDASWRLAPRTWHDLLLVLARERMADAERGLSDAECGWMYFDELCRRLGRSRRRVNVEVFRARQQVADLGVTGAADLIERRAPTRQVRLGVAGMSIAPL